VESGIDKLKNLFSPEDLRRFARKARTDGGREQRREVDKLSKSRQNFEGSSLADRLPLIFVDRLPGSFLEVL